nr:ABC transporter ATP-binding protein [Bifidobacterium goeldii]
MRATQAQSASSQSAPLVELHDLTRTFMRRGKPFDAVSHVNLAIVSGQFVAVTGRSGNGKSTLINMIAGLVRPSSGYVRVDGHNVAELSDRDISLLRNQTIGCITQSQTLLANLTVIDNVILPATLFDHCAQDTHAADTTADGLQHRAQTLLDQLGIADLADSYPKELSGGEMRRVSIARALMNHPKLLIADEPTGDLDAESTVIVMQLLRAAADAGTAVLMVTHDPDALEYVDRTYRMDRGMLTAIA